MMAIIILCAIASCAGKKSLKLPDTENIELLTVKTIGSEMVEFQLVDTDSIREFVNSLTSEAQLRPIKFKPRSVIIFLAEQESYSILFTDNLLKFDGRTYVLESSVSSLLPTQ